MQPAYIIQRKYRGDWIDFPNDVFTRKQLKSGNCCLAELRIKNPTAHYRLATYHEKGPVRMSTPTPEPESVFVGKAWTENMCYVIGVFSGSSLAEQHVNKALHNDHHLAYNKLLS